VELCTNSLLNFLQAVQKNPQFQERYLSAIHHSLRAVVTLAAELRCQRGIYAMDNSVKLGDIYDESTMHDVNFSDDDEDDDQEKHVIAIISRGWMKLPFEGAKEVLAHICKTRVLVAATPSEPHMQSAEEAATGQLKDDTGGVLIDG
jgi:hypothetical protein